MKNAMLIGMVVAVALLGGCAGEQPAATADKFVEYLLPGDEAKLAAAADRVRVGFGENGSTAAIRVGALSASKEARIWSAWCMLQLGASDKTYAIYFEPEWAQNDPRAMLVMGMLVLRQARRSRPVDEAKFREAFEWFQKTVAAEGDARDGLLWMGRAYCKGWGTPRDDAKAWECFSRVANEGTLPIRWSALRYMLDMESEGRRPRTTSRDDGLIARREKALREQLKVEPVLFDDKSLAYYEKVVADFMRQASIRKRRERLRNLPSVAAEEPDGVFRDCFAVRKGRSCFVASVEPATSNKISFAVRVNSNGKSCRISVGNLDSECDLFLANEGDVVACRTMREEKRHEVSVDVVGTETPVVAFRWWLDGDPETDKPMRVGWFKLFLGLADDVDTAPERRMRYGCGVVKVIDGAMSNGPDLVVGK